MDPPADSGHLPALDQTTGAFSDQTTASFATLSTSSFDDSKKSGHLPERDQTSLSFQDNRSTSFTDHRSDSFADRRSSTFADNTNATFVDQTNATFVDRTSGTFNDQTTTNFTDKTSIPPISMPCAKIVLWGDSLTQTGFDGWIAQLANRYQRRADIVNRGMSGYNTSWFLLLPEEHHDNVALCTIWFGANDASLPDLNPHHYVSVQDYQTNLRLLVEQAKKLLKPSSSSSLLRILIMTPPPVHHEQRLAYQKQRYGDKATGELERTLANSGIYANACQQVATELKLPCVNLWDKFQTDDNWGRFLSDGLHFSSEGHDFVYRCVNEAIQEHFPDLAVTPCPHTGQFCNSSSQCDALSSFLGPYHDQIDSKNPSGSMKQIFSSSSSTADDVGDTSSTTTNNNSKKPKMDAP
jgi:isoamyl acetate esterase